MNERKIESDREKTKREPVETYIFADFECVYSEQFFFLFSSFESKVKYKLQIEKKKSYTYSGRVVESSVSDHSPLSTINIFRFLFSYSVSFVCFF